MEVEFDDVRVAARIKDWGSKRVETAAEVLETRQRKESVSTGHIGHAEGGRSTKYSSFIGWQNLRNF